MSFKKYLKMDLSLMTSAQLEEYIKRLDTAHVILQQQIEYLQGELNLEEGEISK